MKFAILGSGNVGTAIARAVTAAGHDVVVTDPDDAALSTLAEQVPVTTTTDAAQAVADADVESPRVS